jgi:hypothetical protein
MMGLSPDLFTLGAGFVEICLSYVMIFGRLALQVAAAVFLVLVISAVRLVGSMDLVGHIPFMVALFILATTRNQIGYASPNPIASWDALRQTTRFVVTILGVMWIYYLRHALAYADLHPLNWTTTLLATLFVVQIINRIALRTRNARAIPAAH